jgi:uncharacterized membrane protein YsdA (DUF1294 family)
MSQGDILMFYFLIYVGILSIIAFFSYMIDKIKSKAHIWRTKEAFLLGVGFFGGAAGAIIGMILFRHKTRHWYFWAVNFLGLIAVAIAAYIIYSIKI